MKLNIWPFKKNIKISPAEEFRAGEDKAAIIFLPGFTAKTSSSWQVFIQYALKMPAIKSWGIIGLNYASKKRFDLRGWEADPDINLLAKYLSTELSLEPFSKYTTITIVAHSMAGLVAQRALLDDAKLANRTSHLVLFGVPSLGVDAASMGALLKRQISDMAVESPFLISLRKDWSERFGKNTPFDLITIAGDVDDFVGPSSSIEPFPAASQHVVPGNHSTMIRPDYAEHPSLILLAKVLQGRAVPDFIDSARLAVELCDFKGAVERLMPHYKELDDAALFTLAMALDGLGRGGEALIILDEVYQGGRKTPAEAAGMLAGRIKRNWLVERRNNDFNRAMELYTQGLKIAEADSDHRQAYYHAINIAFLQLMGSVATADTKQVTAKMCRKALEHCQNAPLDHWRLATEGEANLMQEDFSSAKKCYRKAASMTDSPRELVSMSSQARRIAMRISGSARVEAVDSWFDKSKSNSTALKKA